MITVDRLFGSLLHLDDSSGPPWRLELWNPSSGAFETLGSVGVVQPSSLLVLTPNPYNFVSDTATDYGQPPDFVTTAGGDVISVGGM